MSRFFTFLSAAILLSGYVHSQGLTLTSGSTVFITANDIFSIDGLVFQPSTGFQLTGPNEITRNTTATTASTYPYILRVYKLNVTPSLYSGNITIYYQDAELNAITEGQLVPAISDGFTWNQHMSGVTRDITGNFVTVTGLNNVSMSELTLMKSSPTLPLQWGNVTARRTGLSTVLIEWETFNEKNTASFFIERSVNGVEWVTVGSKRSYGLEGNFQYEMNDLSAPVSKLFYRIRQTDIDGRYSYSEVRIVDEADSPVLLTMYPNPVSHTVTILMQGITAASIERVDITSADGKQVRSEKVNRQTRYQVDVSVLPAGIYWVNIVLTDNSTVRKTIIKN